MKKETLLKVKERADAARVARFLRDLADRVESGRVVLKQGDEEIVADLAESLTLEVSLDQKDKGQKGTKKSLEVEVEWYEAGEGTGPIELG